ncbi:MAG: FkbM family methyltransferase [Betaproteobacteria bacterium]|nr:FkbM family methyltransferase [Betaproteobacteria bacterium]
MSDPSPLKEWVRAAKRLAPVRFLRGLFFDGATVKKAEPDVWSFIERNIKSGARCVDVGANRGEFSFLIAKQAGDSGQVYAFELHPDTVRLLRSNLWQYRRRVKTENMAVSDGHTRRVDVFAGPNQSAAEWNIVGGTTPGQEGKPQFSAPATSLDAYLPPGERIDLVKIDVEGAAGKVLAGMTRVPCDARPLVVLEIRDQAEWEGRCHLETAGYAMHDLHGKRLGSPKPFVFHCVAVPRERHAQCAFVA